MVRDRLSLSGNRQPVASVPQSTGQNVVEDDSEAEAVVNQFDTTLADSEDGDATKVSVPVPGSSSTDGVGVPVLHEDSGTVGGSSADETDSFDRWGSHWPEMMTTVLGRACESGFG